MDLYVIKINSRPTLHDARLNHDNNDKIESGVKICAILSDLK